MQKKTIFTEKFFFTEKNLGKEYMSHFRYTFFV